MVTKRTILFCCLLASAGLAYASTVVLVNPTSAPITNRVTQLITSADTLAYRGMTNAFINPTLPATGSPNEWKVSNGAVMVLSVADSNTITAYNSNLNWLAISNRTAQAKLSATNNLDDLIEDGRIFRAFAQVVLDEINILRTRTTTNALSQRTMGQLKTAIVSNILAQPDFTP
jgi:hypothetical protein